jgi:hypothetical protein
MSFRIRRREPFDDAEWLRMRRELWPHETKEAHQIEMAAWVARSDAVILVADRRDGQRLAGFAEVGTRLYADGCDTGPVALLDAIDSQRAHESLGFIEVERAVRYRKRL